MRILLTLLALFSVSEAWARADEHCISAPYLKASTEEQRVLAAIYHEIIPVLGRYPSFGEALEIKSPRLCLSTKMDNAHAYFDAENNQIVISQTLSRAMQAGVLLHELRHLWQFTQAFWPSNELAMKEYAHATFALEADASAISLLVAWDMKENGDATVWNALSSWPSHSDIAASFAKTIRETGDASLAATSAFYQWYACPDRMERYYLATCSDYLDRQDASHLIPRYQMIETNFFVNLCKLPNGGTYRCSDPSDAPD